MNWLVLWLNYWENIRRNDYMEIRWAWKCSFVRIFEIQVDTASRQSSEVEFCMQPKIIQCSLNKIERRKEMKINNPEGERLSWSWKVSNQAGLYRTLHKRNKIDIINLTEICGRFLSVGGQ